jgi:hypothetical protein
MRKLFGLPDPYQSGSEKGRAGLPSSQAKKVRKFLISTVFLSLENDENVLYLQKVISQKLTIFC